MEENSMNGITKQKNNFLMYACVTVAAISSKTLM